MKISKIIFLVIGFCILNSESFTQVHQDWLTRTDSVSAENIAVDKIGNVYVTGSIYRGTSGFNICLTKYDPDGNQQWMSEYNGIGDDSDSPTAIALDTSGNIFVTGYSFRGPALTNDEIVTLKYNPNGDTLWVRHYNSPGTRIDRAFALTVDSAGNAYVGGYLNNISFGNVYGQDYITIKYSPDGTQLWASQYHVFDGSVNDLVVDPNGNVYVTGVGHSSSSTSSEYITIKYNSNGNSIWVNRYDGSGTESDVATAIAIDDSGYVYVTGYSVGSNGYYDYVTLKYAGDGVEQWNKRFDGPVNEDDKAIGIVVDKNQNVYVTGEASVVSGSFVRDFATIKYNKDGDSIWVKLYNGPGNSLDSPVDIAIDSIGNLYITGGSIGTGFSGYPDYATIKYDSNGDSLWVQRYNAADLQDQPEAIAVDKSGNVYVTGNSQDSFTSSGSVTIKYSQTPIPVELEAFAATAEDRDVTLNWKTATETNTSMFQVERSLTGNWEVAGSVRAAGTSTEKKEYSFMDKNLNSGKYQYRLKMIDLDGTYEYSNVTEVEIGVPVAFGLSQNYPNPFNPTTTIKFGVPNTSNVKLELFNILGEKIATLIDKEMEAGYHNYQFSIVNYQLTSGVYIYKLQSGEFAQSRKFLLMK